MASTTLMPLDPALNPQRVVRVLNISADLLPEEIVAARRARRSRAWVVVALPVIVAMLGGWYVYADRAVHSANDDLSAVTGQATTLQKSQTRYQQVVDVQNETTTISQELKALLANDVPWANVFDTLRSTGSASGVQVRGINAILTKATGATAIQTLPSTSGAATIGTVTITGSAPDKPSVAKYVDALGKLTEVANPYLTNAAKSDSNGAKAWQFSITVDITSTTLCGRFTTKCTSGGK
jgi:hypothetical protein